MGCAEWLILPCCATRGVIWNGTPMSKVPRRASKKSGKPGMPHRTDYGTILHITYLLFLVHCHNDQDLTQIGQKFYISHVMSKLCQKVNTSANSLSFTYHTGQKSHSQVIHSNTSVTYANFLYQKYCRIALKLFDESFVMSIQ